VVKDGGFIASDGEDFRVGGVLCVTRAVGDYDPDVRFISPPAGLLASATYLAGCIVCCVLRVAAAREAARYQRVPCNYNAHCRCCKNTHRRPDPRDTRRDTGSDGLLHCVSRHRTMSSLSSRVMACGMSSRRSRRSTLREGCSCRCCCDSLPACSTFHLQGGTLPAYPRYCSHVACLDRSGAFAERGV
jgi:hypothetical protein